MSILFGIHQQYHGDPETTPGWTTPEATLEDFPKTTHTREFTGGDVPLPPQNLVPLIKNACMKSWVAGLTAIWSFKPDRDAMARDEWRPFLEQLCAWLFQMDLHQRTIIVIHHEPENDMPGKDFVDMFNRGHDIIKNVSSDILTCHAALSYRYHPKIKGAIDPKSFKTRADIHAIDFYSGRTWPVGWTLPEAEVFKRWYDAIPGSLDGVWSTTERGFIADAENDAKAADTIDRETQWLMNDPVGKLCQIYVTWDTIGVEKDPLIPLGPMRKVAMQRLMHQITSTPVPVELPPPTPEPKPTHSHTVQCPTCKGTGNFTFTVES